jgi:membrane-bound lytic murein transglycosylase B
VPRLLLALTLAVALLPAGPARAAGGEMAPTPLQYAQGWHQAQSDLAAAAARTAALKAQPPPAELVGALRYDLQLAVAEYDFREAVRAQQVVVYALAVDQGLESQVVSLLPAGQAGPLQRTTEALRALWRAAGIDDFKLVRMRTNRRFQESAPVAQLLTFYRASGGRYAIDWTYLASINFIESDFGRVNGPSSAGAMGPMQFMPGTWSDYGNGGDIMSPRDSIEAAARYLRAMGGPGNMDRAIYRYNNDADYVASVKGFAGAIRDDAVWLDRLYYWSTSG